MKKHFAIAATALLAASAAFAQDMPMTMPGHEGHDMSGEEPVGSSRVDLQACKLEYSIVSPK